MGLSTSYTLEGFLRGMQGSMMGLIGSLIAILVCLIIAHWLISQGEDERVGGMLRSGANKIAGFIAVLTILGFAWHAATYGTNAIPRSDIDGSSVYDQMKRNLK